jgi:hypothetical protein
MGIQREIDKDNVFEIRYIGNRGHKLWRQTNLNETNVFENGFLNEFRLAQGNALANLAAGRFGCAANQNPCTNANRLVTFALDREPEPPRCQPCLHLTVVYPRRKLETLPTTIRSPAHPPRQHASWPVHPRRRLDLCSQTQLSRARSIRSIQVHSEWPVL